jgi:hypothetical protein
VKDRNGNVIPDQVDLGLDSEALVSVHEGMIRVVNSRMAPATARG